MEMYRLLTTLPSNQSDLCMMPLFVLIVISMILIVTIAVFWLDTFCWCILRPSSYSALLYVDMYTAWSTDGR